jgi:hypothetical protein
MTGMALAIIAAYGLAPIPKVGVILASLVIVLLPISDVPGLVYAPALAAWIAATGVVAYCDHRRGYAALLWAGALLTWALVIMYFQGYSHKPLAMSVTQWRAVLLTALGFVAGGLGPVGRQLWPPVLRVLPAAVFLTTFAAIGWAAARSDQPPFRSRAMLLFFIGAACLVAALALGRPGTPAWVGRYFLLAALIWCAAFLAWPLCFKPRVAWMAQVAMLPLLIGIAPWNFHEGLLYARDYHSRMEEFRADLLSGMSPAQLVARHVVSLDPCPFSGYPDVGVEFRWGNPVRISKSFPITGAVSFHDWIADKLRKLHAAKIGDYARMQPNDPPLREIIPSPVGGFAVSRATDRNDPTAAEETAVLLTPDLPLYVVGIRIRRPIDLASSAIDVPVDEGGRPTAVQPPWVQVFWRLAGESEYTVPHRYVFAWQAGKDEQIVWIFQEVDQIAFHMGNRDVQRRLSAEHLPVTLLVPVEPYAH